MTDIPKTHSFVVEWMIDVEVDSPDPRAAALEVWTRTFGRSAEPGPDETCVFTVTDEAGVAHHVDLADEEATMTTAPQVPTMVVIELLSGREIFAMPDGARVERIGDELVIRSRAVDPK